MWFQLRCCAWHVLTAKSKKKAHKMPWLQLSECHSLEGAWKNEYNDFYTQRKGIHKYIILWQ
jgi:hypothetical protein